MQNHSADQLHIEVHHVPGHRLIADAETVTVAPSAGARRFSPPRTLPAKFHRAGAIAPPSSGILASSSFQAAVLARKVVVRERLELLVELVDPTHGRRQAA